MGKVVKFAGIKPVATRLPLRRCVKSVLRIRMYKATDGAVHCTIRTEFDCTGSDW